MRYMCLIYEAADPNQPLSPEEQDKDMQAYMAFTQEMVDRGFFKGGDPLEPPATATTVRVVGEETITTDGPYAETKEWLAGYYELECEDLDQAIEAAAKIPSASHGAIEVRPIMELPPELTGAS